MNRLLLLLLLSCCWLFAAAQVPDFITVRKPNGRTVKHITTGTPVNLQLKNGNYLNGVVAAIRNDSVFVQVLIQRRYMSSLGVPMIENIGSVVQAVHYRAIDRVQLNRRFSFWRRQGPPLMVSGGGGYILLNVVNGGIYGASVGDRQNLQRLGRAGAVALAGLAWRKLFPINEFSMRRHRILYINMQVPRSKGLN